MQQSGVRPSVRLSVCTIRPVLVWCWFAAVGPATAEISIDCCTAGEPAVSSSRAAAAARRAAANACTATLVVYRALGDTFFQTTNF